MARKNEAKYRASKRTECNQRISEWKKNNLHKLTFYASRRRSQELNATPKWANEFFIEEIYDLAQLRSKALGIKFHVDHIVPLLSDKVCGLHEENNLQIIPALANLKKNNRHWPDMP